MRWTIGANIMIGGPEAVSEPRVGTASSERGEYALGSWVGLGCLST